MRRVKIFSGTSHPLLTAAICDRLGTTPAKCELSKFSNGETSVSIGSSIRDQDVFIVQSGSKNINDSLIELLIMISACKGGSAKSITAVMPYFPYCRQSKKKSHRGAITARMVANLLSVAGVNHIITVDLHASPMQGFFAQPVDNLRAEPLIARWIRMNVPDWQEAVVVSKNPGGSKRVTSLADVLKLNFGIITTDRRRLPMGNSMVLDSSYAVGLTNGTINAHDQDSAEPNGHAEEEEESSSAVTSPRIRSQFGSSHQSHASQSGVTSYPSPTSRPLSFAQRQVGGSPLTRSTRPESISPPARPRPVRSVTSPLPLESPLLDGEGEEYTDERARDVITGRLYQGHIVDDDFPSPMLSTMSGSVANLNSLSQDQIGESQFDERHHDPMTSSFLSVASSFHQEHSNAQLGNHDLSDEEDGLKDPEVEHTITLVGNVLNKTVFIIDDIMDGSESWTAAAETVVKRGGAKKVYCIATHGLFADNSIEEMENCECIDHILVSNTFPIDEERSRGRDGRGKLQILDLSGLLSEAIRRNHYGESISQLYQHYQD